MVPRTLIVKLGGSLAHSPQLRNWLDALAEHGRGRVVVVPGGGPFADAVRNAQAALGFDDRTAHAMALLAMQQYGAMLAGLCSGLLPAGGADGVRAALAAGQLPIWLPKLAELDADGVPASWDVTSDSLAAWLAGKLDADGLLMLKCAPVAAGAALDDLSARGVIDAAFMAYAEASRCPVHWLGPQDSGRLAELLAEVAD